MVYNFCLGSPSIRQALFQRIDPVVQIDTTYFEIMNKQKPIRQESLPDRFLFMPLEAESVPYDDFCG